MRTDIDIAWETAKRVRPSVVKANELGSYLGSNGMLLSLIEEAFDAEDWQR